MFRIPESQNPLGWPGVPDVLLWPLALKVHSTVSPASIVTEEGKKKKPPSPTVTIVVAASAGLGQSARRSPTNRAAAARPTVTKVARGAVAITRRLQFIVFFADRSAVVFWTECCINAFIHPGIDSAVVV